MKQALSVSIHLTHQCNLACDYCYTGAKIDVSMSKDILHQTLSFIHAYIQEEQVKQLTIIFFGGEPLLEWHSIREIHNVVATWDFLEGLHFQMSTNGTLITESIMRELVQRDVHTSISMDGTPEMHNIHRKNRGGTPSAHKIEEAAKTMLKWNPCTNVTCVITPETAHSVHDGANYLFDLGFRYITTTLDYSTKWTLDDFKRLKQSYHLLADWYKKKMWSEERFYLSFFDERIRTRSQKPIQAHEKCGMGTYQLSIAPNGEIYPCIQFVKTGGLPEFLIGHVREGIFKESQRFYYDKSKDQHTDCSGCLLKNRCSTWCSCVNFMDTGRVDEPSPIACMNERILIEIVDRTADELWNNRNNMFIHKFYNENYPIYAYLDITTDE